MKKYNTSYRLNQVMSERNLKQVDILKLAEPYCKEYGIKLNKNDLSQYVSGKVEPGQHKLFILGLALKINEAWLMGFDNVPMSRDTNMPVNFTSTLNLTEHETTVITAYHNNPDMQSAIDRILGIKSANPTEKGTKIIAPIEIEDDNKQKLLNNYDKLNDDGQSKLLDYSADLVSGGRYVKNNQLFGAKEA